MLLGVKCVQKLNASISCFFKINFNSLSKHPTKRKMKVATQGVRKFYFFEDSQLVKN